MFVEELDVAIVDTFGNLLADLMWRPALNHVQARPSVLCLCARGGTDKQIVLELSLKTVLFDMVGQSGGNFPSSCVSVRIMSCK